MLEQLTPEREKGVQPPHDTVNFYYHYKYLLTGPVKIKEDGEYLLLSPPLKFVQRTAQRQSRTQSEDHPERPGIWYVWCFQALVVILDWILAWWTKQWQWKEMTWSQAIKRSLRAQYSRYRKLLDRTVCHIEVHLISDTESVSSTIAMRGNRIEIWNRLLSLKWDTLFFTTLCPS